MTLPDFIIAGERRSGTTSLATWLRAQPGVFVHPKQDRGWFIDDTVRARSSSAADWEATHDIVDYGAWFDAAGAGDHRLVGEKSADYLFWRPAHERLARHLPATTRFVIVLRNPVARAWSHYWNEVAKRRERLSFEDALAAEDERLAASDYQRYNFSYLARGHYGASLEAFLSHVERERVLVVAVEDMWRDPAGVLGRVNEFIGVEGEVELAAVAGARNANWAMVEKPFARSGPMRLAARGLDAIARPLSKLAAGGKEQRRALLARLKSPLFEPAARQRMDQRLKARLEERFAKEAAHVRKLTGKPFPDWFA